MKEQKQHRPSVFGNRRVPRILESKTNSEVRCSGSGECESGGSIFYYSGNNITSHRNGVGIIHKEMRKYVSDFIPYSDRALLLKLNAKPVNLNIIQVYAPTADKDDDEVESFYEESISQQHTPSILYLNQYPIWKLYIQSFYIS